MNSARGISFLRYILEMHVFGLHRGYLSLLKQPSSAYMPHGHGQKLRGLSKAIHQHTCATGECGDCESYVKRQPSKQLDLTHLQAAQPSLMLLQASDQNKKNRDLCYGFPVASKRQVDDFPVHFPSATGSSITGGWDFVLLTGRKKAQWFLSE